jgi:hypothetical protein
MSGNGIMLLAYGAPAVVFIAGLLFLKSQHVLNASPFTKFDDSTPAEQVFWMVMLLMTVTALFMEYRI